MYTISRGGFGDLYGGELCQEYRDLHVFETVRHFSIVCECGLKKKVACKCECGDSHRKDVDTTPEERVAHELLRLQFRVHVLEASQRPLTETAAEGSETTQ